MLFGAVGRLNRTIAAFTRAAVNLWLLCFLESPVGSWGLIAHKCPGNVQPMSLAEPTNSTRLSGSR